HLFPVAIKFLGQQHGQRGVDTLSHLGLVDDDGHAVVAAYAQEGVGCKGCHAVCSGCPAKGDVTGQNQSAPHDCAGLNELAPAHLDHLAHDFFPSLPVFPAAVWIARRMRPYVPQRQRLPLMALSISASVGWGFCASSATALMICPGWQ